MPSSLYKTKVIPLHLYLSNGLVLEKCYFPIDDIKLDLKFEHSLFRTQSDSNVSQVVVDIEGLNTFVPKDFFELSKQDKDQFWDFLCQYIREKLKNIESLRKIDPLDFLAKRNFEVLS